MFSIIKGLALSAVAAGTLGLAVAGNTLPASAEDTWQYERADSLQATYGLSDSSAAKAASRDKNADGTVQTKVIPGSGGGNTGAGLNVKDNRDGEGVIVIPITPTCPYPTVDDENVWVLIGPALHHTQDDFDLNGNSYICQLGDGDGNYVRQDDTLA